MPSSLGIVASGEDVLNDAVLWLDASLSSVSGGKLTNLGKGGSALDAQFGSTTSTDTNDPLLLTHTGTNYLYLPGVAGNSVSCTAPGTTVSYAATPVGGGGDTTGAATGGAAFTFSTTGSWSSVRLLNAGGSTVAQFTVDAGSQTALTDAFGVVWALNRATSGRKSVAVTRNVLLFGTDDYLEVPNNSLLDFNASQSMTMLIVLRSWATPVSFGRLMDRADATSVKGWTLQIKTDRTLFAQIGDGTNVATRSSVSTLAAAGALASAGMVVNRTAQTITSFAGSTLSATASTSLVGSTSNALPMDIGKPASGLTYMDMEFIAAAVFRRVLTTNEIATIVARYT